MWRQTQQSMASQKTVYKMEPCASYKLRIIDPNETLIMTLKKEQRPGAINFYQLKYLLFPLWCWLKKLDGIMSRHQHGYPWPSLATLPYRSFLPSGLQGHIPYLHRAVVCRFELVVLTLLVHVKRSTGAHHLRARPYFSSSVQNVWFV